MNMKKLYSLACSLFVGAMAVAQTTPAPTPTQAAGTVISLFSNAYTNVAVDTWSTPWDVADVLDTVIQGNDTKKYYNFVFCGIEFVGANMINASAMTHFHIDYYTPNCPEFKVKLVDFGADGGFGGGDDTEHELTYTAPALNTWNSLDIPLSAFTGLVNRAHLAQLIMVGTNSTVYMDNIYFYQGSGGSSFNLPAAPVPTHPASDVISLFSNAYTNNTVDTWSTVWDNADVADTAVSGDDIKVYTNFVFAGIEFISSMVDASAMDFFHIDYYTYNAANFNVKLVDFGADGAFAGGDDTEHELSFTPNQNAWNSLDIPFGDFVNLTNRAHLAQLILVSSNSKVYIDNAYFHKAGSGGANDSVNITINVNTSSITVDPAGIFLTGGGNFGNPGDYPMDDSDADGVYTITVRQPKGFTSFYTFTNGNCPDYSCKENIAGQPCAIPSNFNDRQMVAVNSDTTISTCFAQCTTDGSCASSPNPIDLTLQVQKAAGETIYIRGQFNNWAFPGDAMDDAENDGIYTITKSFVPGSVWEFLFCDGTNNEAMGGNLDSTCTNYNSQFTNRVVQVPSAAATMCYKWETCDACDFANGIDDLYAANQLVAIQGNPVTNALNLDVLANGATEITIMSATGTVVAKTMVHNSGKVAIAVDQLASGLYIVQASNGDFRQVERIVKY